MKVCTDSCLFGAVVASELSSYNTVLDIGTGTGLLSLMYAQKNTNSGIDAVEIDRNAFLQARENVTGSSFDNIHIVHGDIKSFDSSNKYGLIICNPPFYVNDLKSTTENRNVAMHSMLLNFDELLNAVKTLLEAGGVFAVLLPYSNQDFFVEKAKNYQLYMKQVILLKQMVKSSFFRSIIYFSDTVNEAKQYEISFKDQDNNYTPLFSSFVKEYYLFL